MLLSCGFYISTLLISAIVATHKHNAKETEMFAIPISPNLFNWTYQEFDQQYRFHTSLKGKPELPSWLRYIYSARHHSGFIFGTPPRGTKSPIILEVIGLNRQDFETRRILLTLSILPKENMALHEVELKIDNLNVEDLLDEHRMTRLKDILRSKLWPESSHDLYATFLASAIDLGARLPLKPSDGEGLVIRLGSSASFSTEIKRLREEVRPLSRLPSCPREFKRTTVERLFRDVGLMLDWCSFELYNTVYKNRTTELIEYLSEMPKEDRTGKISKALHTRPAWSAPNKHSLPSRSYTKQLTAAIAAPLLLLVLSVASLTAVMCFHYATVPDEDSEYFLDNIFHICIEYKKRRANRPGNVEVCRYGTNNTEQTQVPDNVSTKSAGVSPNNSLVRPYSPKSTTNLAGSYNRPQPPPYMGSATNSLHNRKTGNERTSPTSSSYTPDHNRGHLALEESIKLLNEAKLTNEFDNIILKDPIMDINDEADDYVPIDRNSFMKEDLDDIDVPELTKYGVSGSIDGI